MKQKVNLILMDGGLGDHVASLVAVDYIIKRYTHIAPIVWVQDYLLTFARHLIPNGFIRSYSMMKRFYDQNLPTKTTKWDGIVSPMKIPLLDYAFLKLCDENPSLENKNYLQVKPDKIDTSNFQLPENYVVITSGYTAKAREFKAEYINAISRYLISKEITPVFLGATKTLTGARHIIEGDFDEDLDLTLGINLINKTSLLEAAKIMSSAKAVLGVDNGLLHVAGCTEVPIIGGFPSVKPEIRLPVRHNILGWNYYSVVPDQDKGCNFCQQTTNFLYGHDYRECVLKNDDSINEMKPEKFIAYLEMLAVKDL
jgi:ADP-heptose:LPS heptosyltransferase